MADEQERALGWIFVAFMAIMGTLILLAYFGSGGGP